MEREYVMSSNLEWIEYLEDEQELHVGFKNGSAYRYEDVPIDVYEGLLNAGSHGSFFYHNIRTSYTYERIQ